MEYLGLRLVRQLHGMVAALMVAVRVVSRLAFPLRENVLLYCCKVQLASSFSHPKLNTLSFTHRIACPIEIST